MNAPTPESRSKTFLLVGIHDGDATPQAALPGSRSGQLDLFDASPDAARLVWLAFTGDHDEADGARRCFQDRYHQAPRRTWRALGGLLLVGPVAEVIQ